MKILKFFLIIIIVFYFTPLNANDYELENKITKNLRCLVCQGQSVYDSDSEFAISLKLVVSNKIKEGLSEDQIYNFLIEKYGDWIVYKPPFNKANTILWIFPYFVLVIGGFFIFLILRKKDNH